MFHLTLLMGPRRRYRVYPWSRLRDARCAGMRHIVRGGRCTVETTSFEIVEASIDIDTLIVHRS